MTHCNSLIASAYAITITILLLVSCRPPADAATSPASTAPVGAAPTPASASKTKLRVALFPWVPDVANDGFESLRKRIEVGFEQAHPDIDVELRMNEGDESYYEPALVAGWLASSRYDLVEIDTIILGDLIGAEVIEPWSHVPERSYTRAAKEGSTTTKEGSTTWWGVPHLNCGYFLVTRAKAIDEASNIDALVAAIGKTDKPVFGNFVGSWDLPSLYLDARVDNGLDPATFFADPAKVPSAVKPPLDEPSVKALERLAGTCKVGKANPCTDGTFAADWDGPVERFVAGDASGFWGYSERLHLAVSLLSAKKLPVDDLRVSTLALGSSATPLLFTDAFVRRAGCSEEPACNAAANAWADYITTDAVLVELLTAKDAGEGAVPRYLLPATTSVLGVEPLKSDRLFQELLPFADSGRAFPPTGSLYERRRVIGYLLEQRLGI